MSTRHKPVPQTMAPLRVLVIEDDADDARRCRLAIAGSDLPCEVLGVSTLGEAVAHLTGSEADVALVDLTLPDARGIEAVKALASQFEGLPLVVLAGTGDVRTAGRALAAGAQDYVVKERSDHESISRAIRYAVVHKHAEEFRRAKESAEAANQAKSVFLARMSHELRTPLTVILGFAQLLEADCVEGQRELVHQILKAGRHLQAVTDDLQDIARIEAGKLTLSMEPVQVREVLAQAVDLIRPLAAARDLTVSLDAGASGVWVRADRHRLGQIFLNLLSNAVKYNHPQGCVVVTAVELEDRRVRIQVRDNGVGLDRAQLTRAFTPFDRLGAEQTETEGTGLGLVITKHLVEAMGGTLALDSAKGVGTTVWTEWSPVEAPSPDPVGVPEAFTVPAGVTARVLHIEDNPTNTTLVRRVLSERPGLTVSVAGNGRLGLQRARQQRPDLILLDLHQPDIGGEEVLARLREDPVTAGTPVIIISADAGPAVRARLLAAGARAYLTKPFSIDELLRLVDTTLWSDTVRASDSTLK